MSDSFVTLWTVAHQALLSMRFPREEYWSGFHFLLQGIIHIQGPLQITKLFNILLILQCVGTSHLQECQQLTWTVCVCPVALVMSDTL